MKFLPFLLLVGCGFGFGDPCNGVKVGDNISQFSNFSDSPECPDEYAFAQYTVGPFCCSGLSQRCPSYGSPYGNVCAEDCSTQRGEVLRTQAQTGFPDGEFECDVWVNDDGTILAFAEYGETG